MEIRNLKYFNVKSHHPGQSEGWELVYQPWRVHVTEEGIAEP